MRRAFVVAVVVAIAAALPVAANAAAWKGVVVAKDSGRSAVVTASRGGVVRTVRVASLSGLKVGQRVAVRAGALSDGTFSATTVRILGRATKARIRAVVVQTKALRTTVSAGGTVFALRGHGAARRLQSAEESLEPGDRIVADVSVDDGSLEVDEIEEVGHTGSVKLEGHFVGLANGVLELRLGDDLIQVSIPEGVSLPELQPGAEVSVRALVGEDGAFTATEVWLNDDPPAESGGEGDDPGEEVEAGEHGDGPGEAQGEESEPSEQAEDGAQSEEGEQVDEDQNSEEGDGEGEGDQATEPGEGDGEPAGEEGGPGGDGEPEGEDGGPVV